MCSDNKADLASANVDLYTYCQRYSPELSSEDISRRLFFIKKLLTKNIYKK